MGLMSSADWAAMAGDTEQICDDNAVSIAIRRGGSTLAGQSVRIAGNGSGRVNDTDGASQSVGTVVVLGSRTLDIQVGDRFTSGGQLYEVEFVRTNRMIGIMAQARMVA